MALTCVQYTDVSSFYEAVYDVLMQAEAQNMVLLGNLIIGYEGKDKTAWRDPAGWVMATVQDEGAILLTALMTPPHNITLYATDNRVDPRAIRCLIAGLEGHKIPGVTTELRLAEAFAREYTALHGGQVTIQMSQRIYELTAVNPEVPTLGKLRLLTEDDMHFFPYWCEAFGAATQYGEQMMHIPEEAAPYLYRIAGRKSYILEDEGVPVSMAGFTRIMQTAIGVALVYTPPYYRRRGYASACVAQLSQMALDQGFERCGLYTDLANPTSNSIYQKIGYTAVCDSLMLSFEA